MACFRDECLWYFICELMEGGPYIIINIYFTFMVIILRQFLSCLYFWCMIVLMNFSPNYKLWEDISRNLDLCCSCHSECNLIWIQIWNWTLITILNVYYLLLLSSNIRRVFLRKAKGLYQSYKITVGYYVIK